MKRRGGRRRHFRNMHRHKFKSHRNRSKSYPNLYYRLKRFIRRNPLVSAVGSIIISVFLFRASFDNILFGANITEFRLWVMFFAFLIGLIGFVAIWVWIRNNVSMLTTRHNVRLR